MTKERPGFIHKRERHGLIGPFSGRQLLAAAVAILVVAIIGIAITTPLGNTSIGPNIANPQGDLSRLKQEMMTDGSGDATFDYSGFYKQGQAGFAVLDIVSFKDSAVGEGIIKIVEQETSEETVILKHI